MRRFLIFFTIGLVIIAGVLFYAQYLNRTMPSQWIAPAFSPQPKLNQSQKESDFSNSSHAIPLKIIIDKNPVLLYWPQKITIETNPNTEVRVVVTYPNGSINNSGTKTGLSDEKGKFVIQWSIKGKTDLIGRADVTVSAGTLDTFTETQANFEIVKTLKNESSPIIPNSNSAPVQSQ